MIKAEKFNKAKPVDFFNDLTKEEKAEADLKANIAIAIHNKRVSMNMNQQEFAELNGVSQTMVSKWESGDYNFTVSNLRRILSSLDMEFVLKDKAKPETLHVSQTESANKWKTASSGGAVFYGYAMAASPNAI